MQHVAVSWVQRLQFAVDVLMMSHYIVLTLVLHAMTCAVVCLWFRSVVSAAVAALQSPRAVSIHDKLIKCLRGAPVRNKGGHQIPQRGRSQRSVESSDQKVFHLKLCQELSFLYVWAYRGDNKSCLSPLLPTFHAWLIVAVNCGEN